MADDANQQPPTAPERSGRMMIVLAIPAAIVAGAAGFAAAWMGLVPISGHADHGAVEGTHQPSPDVAFVPIDAVTIPLGEAGRHQLLRLGAQLEVAPAQAANVAHLMPRILDVINAYLRAVDVAELDDRAALVRIRAHLLRRIKIVTGDTGVRDLLITEFLLN
jgi:flagellar FliL protein